MLTALTGYLTSPLLFVILTAVIAVHHHVGEEVGVGADDLAGHGRLRDVDQRVPTERVDLGADVLVHVLDRLPQRQPVACDDGGGVDLVLHELVRPPQQLGRYYDDGGGAIPDLLVLLLGEVDEDLACGVLDVE